jgi:hypothetical protein
MRSADTSLCDRCAEPILSGEWTRFPSSDPRRIHIQNCQVCRDRIEEVRFFGEAFSSDTPNVSLVKGRRLAEQSTPRNKRESSFRWVGEFVKWSAVAAAACFVAIVIWRQFQPEGIGRIQYVRGEATIQRFGSRDRKSLGDGADVYLGDTIRTDPGASLGLALEETNLVYLNESSEVRVEGKRLLHHNLGETWFEIAKGQGEFEVETRGADVLVLGTAFGVEYSGDVVLVPVARGRVRLQSKGGEIDLEPGHVGAYSSSAPFLPPHRKTDLYPVDHPSWIVPQSVSQ